MHFVYSIFEYIHHSTSSRQGSYRTSIYDMGVFQFFVVFEYFWIGSTHGFFLWPYSNQSAKGRGDPNKPWANSARNQIMSALCTIICMCILSYNCTVCILYHTEGSWCFHSYHLCIHVESNIPIIDPFPDKIEPLCVPSYHTKLTSRSYILKQAKFLTIWVSYHLSFFSIMTCRVWFWLDLGIRVTTPFNHAYDAYDH